jgi:hypothetical protein
MRPPCCDDEEECCGIVIGKNVNSGGGGFTNKVIRHDPTWLSMCNANQEE